MTIPRHRLRIDDPLATRLDLAVYDSLVIRQAGQRSDKTRPNGRFMKADSYNGGPVYKERDDKYFLYKETRPGLVINL